MGESKSAIVTTEARSQGRRLGGDDGVETSAEIKAWLGVTGRFVQNRTLSHPMTRLCAALSGHAVSVVLKKRCELAGLDPAIFGAHSLRSGFLTSAAEAGASVFKMMEVSRHRSIDVLRGYVRRADLFHEHAGAALTCQNMHAVHTDYAH